MGRGNTDFIQIIGSLDNQESRSHSAEGWASPLKPGSQPPSTLHSPSQRALLCHTRPLWLQSLGDTSSVRAQGAFSSTLVLGVIVRAHDSSPPTGFRGHLVHAGGHGWDSNNAEACTTGFWLNERENNHTSATFPLSFPWACLHFPNTSARSSVKENEGLSLSASFMNLFSFTKHTHKHTHTPYGRSMCISHILPQNWRSVISIF